MKRCKECGVDKPLTEYTKHKTSKDGVLARCKVCRNNSEKAYRHTPEGQEAVKAAQKRFYENNREERLQAQKAYEQSDRGRDVKRRSRQKNADRVAAYRKQWKTDNRDRTRAYDENRRARILDGGGPLPSNYRQVVFEHYGRRCLVPGCEKADIEVDHVVPLSRGGRHDYSNMQPMCRFHNTSKNAYSSADYRDGNIMESYAARDALHGML